MLSGYLITTLLCEEKESTGIINLRRFYFRRVLRLAPALLMFLGAIAVMSVSGNIEHVRLYEFLACIFYLRNIIGRNEAVAHLWSLSLEEQFYMLWPPIMKFVKSARLLRVSLFFVAAICLWRGLAMQFHLFDYNMGIYYMRPWFRMDSILIGCCLGLILKEARRMPELISAVPIVVIWLSLMAWTLIAPVMFPWLCITGQMVGCLWVLYRAIHGSKFPILASQPFCFLGKISYSLYLWQQIFLEVRSPSWGALHSFPLNLLASVVLAIASHYLIEKPFLRLKDKRGIREQPGSAELLTT